MESTVVHIRGDDEDHHPQKAKPSLFSAFCAKLSRIGSGEKDGYFSRPFIHSIKVGVALVFVSLLYLVRPLYDQVGDNAMWAIMTVVVMFEFYAGATLSKGLNRGMGTIMGGGLGCLAAFLARQVGEIPRAVTIGISVFFFGSLATYARMVPRVKQKFDYGALIFILTFNLIAVSGVRGEEIIKLTIDRLMTIAMGFTLCIFVSLMIFPIWASDELHRALVDKFDCLARSIEECLAEYFKPIDENSEASSKPSDCLSVLNSKAKDELLANFARWEPWHGKFGFFYPWNKYLQIAKLLRELAASVFTLRGVLSAHSQWSPVSSRLAIKEACEGLGTLLSFTLTELGDSVFNMRKYQTQESVGMKLHSTRQLLSLALSNSPVALKVENGNDAIGGGLLVTFVISLMDIADKVEALAKEIEDLGNAARFPSQ
ncbi:hypothetical protein H6P81_002467 [Aristolochia fimbriata]|uniref:Aluminum-activated malate transporter n=1 Tax=Aristolochia fimbriata TaxID=158543 RepID=A0AAV7FBL9_ARIFI|nr:hypothetical protein H6P81_002467 [Aristolochia fimbriata]